MLYVRDEIHLSYRAYFIGGILYMTEKKGEKMIGSYDIKVPEDTDVTLGYDMTANKVKNFKFSGIWTWIVSKLKGESISDLNTTNKTVVGAIKEVNTPTFTTATSRANINSGESQSIIMGKLKKWLADLGTAAFCSVVNNLTTTAEGSVLDARQGKNLSDALTKLNTLMGNTDISAIGGGTLTGAISELNSNRLERYDTNKTRIFKIENKAAWILVNNAGANGNNGKFDIFLYTPSYSNVPTIRKATNITNISLTASVDDSGAVITSSDLYTRAVVIYIQ